MDCVKIKCEDGEEKDIGSVESIGFEYDGYVPKLDTQNIGTETIALYNEEVEFTCQLDTSSNNILNSYFNVTDDETESWDEQHIFNEELDKTHHCINCDRKFDQHTWRPHTGFDDVDSNKWVYSCPTNNCRTVIVVKLKGK